jgi:ATP-binding protein involved in chromosome partitioning
MGRGIWNYKEGAMMSKNRIKIAIPMAEDKLCLHFGHCERFALLDVDLTGRKIISRADAVPPPHEPGVLPRWLAEQKVEMLWPAAWDSGHRGF